MTRDYGVIGRVYLYKLRQILVVKTFVYWFVVTSIYLIIRSEIGIEFSQFSDLIAVYLTALPLIGIAAKPALPNKVLSVLGCIEKSGGKGCTFREITSQTKLPTPTITPILVHLERLEVIKSRRERDDNITESMRYYLWFLT